LLTGKVQNPCSYDHSLADEYGALVNVKDNASWGFPMSANDNAAPWFAYRDWTTTYQDLALDGSKTSSRRIRGPQRYTCGPCQEGFERAAELQRHAASAGHATYRCRSCPKQYTRPDSLARHVAKKHDSFKSGPCDVCTGAGVTKIFSRKDHYHQHLREVHAREPLISESSLSSEILLHGHGG